MVLGVEDEDDAVADGGGDGVGGELEAGFSPYDDLFLLVWNYSGKEEEGRHTVCVAAGAATLLA